MTRLDWLGGLVRRGGVLWRTLGVGRRLTSARKYYRLPAVGTGLGAACSFAVFGKRWLPFEGPSFSQAVTVSFF